METICFVNNDNYCYLFRETCDRKLKIGFVQCEFTILTLLN